MTRSLFLVAAVLAARSAHADVPAETFMGISPYAATGAMAEAVVAGRGAAAALGNPALLFDADREVSLSHVSWFQDYSLNAFTYAGPVYGDYPLGFGVTRMGDQQRARQRTGDPGTAFSNSSTEWTVGSARRVSKGRLAGLTFGAALSFVFEHLGIYEGQAFAARLGTAYDLPIDLPKLVRDEGIPLLRLGAAVGPLGPPVAVRNASAPLPLGARAGASLEDWIYGLVASAQADIEPMDSVFLLRVGASYERQVTVVAAIVRAGYVYSSAAGPETGPRAGFGIAVPWNGLRFVLDYAFAPYGELGMTHRVTLSAVALPGSRYSGRMTGPRAVSTTAEVVSPTAPPSPAETAAATSDPTTTPTTDPDPSPEASASPVPTATGTPTIGAVTPAPSSVVSAVSPVVSKVPASSTPSLTPTLTLVPISTESPTTSSTSTSTSTTTPTPKAAESPVGEAPKETPPGMQSPASPESVSGTASADGIPLHLRAEAKGSGIRLDWDAPTGAAGKGYNVYRAGSKKAKLRKINEGTIRKMNYFDFDVAAGRTYRYVVRAIDAAGAEGPPTDEVEAARK